jgi:Holliday junction resolvasome RuvABC endonuclease subunit
LNRNGPSFKIGYGKTNKILLNHHVKWLKKIQSKWTYNDDAIAIIICHFWLIHSKVRPLA